MTLLLSYYIYIIDLINESTQQWDRNILQAVFSPLECNEILKIPLSMFRLQPKFIWHFSKSGVPNVKSLYYQLKHRNEQTDGGPSSSRIMPSQVWKHIWNITAPLKIKSFLEKVCSNSIAINKNLFRRNCAPSPHKLSLLLKRQ